MNTEGFLDMVDTPSGIIVYNHNHNIAFNSTLSGSHDCIVLTNNTLDICSMPARSIIYDLRCPALNLLIPFYFCLFCMAPVAINLIVNNKTVKKPTHILGSASYRLIWPLVTQPYNPPKLPLFSHKCPSKLCKCFK